MAVSVVTKSAGSFGVWAVLVKPNGKAVWGGPIHAASNWKAAVAGAKVIAAEKGWTVVH